MTTIPAAAIRIIALPDKPRRESPSRAKSSAAQRAAALKRQHELAERRQRRLIILAVVAAVVALVVVFAIINQSGDSGNGPSAGASTGSAASGSTGTGGLGYEGIPLQVGPPLAGLANAATGKTVNGIECSAQEQVAYHIHSHLAIFQDGVLRPVAIGVGIVKPVMQDTGKGQAATASQCYYWLHTHTNDGVLHVESPTSKIYNLGDFFAIWGQPLSANQVGPAKGTVTAYVNGKVYSGDPANIPLSSHEDIQLNVGKNSPPPQSIDWSKSQL